MKYFADIENQCFEVNLIDERQISINGEVLPFDVRQGSKPEHFSLLVNGQSYQVWIENAEETRPSAPKKFRIHIQGYDFDVCVDDERSRKLREFNSSDASALDEGRVVAPMPGLVVKLLVQPGQQVSKGEGVAIVEAMKMENEIRAPIGGEVKEIAVQERQAVEKGEVLAVVG